MIADVVFDPDLIRRYDLAGPRYTSYPTAVQFHDGFDEGRYRACVERSNETQPLAPLSLYVHLPFCATVCYYCACNKIVTANRAHAGAYVETLVTEIARQGELFDQARAVEQLHWGGGTPTFLALDEMARVMDATRRHFSLLDDDCGEYGIEVDPRTVDARGVHALRDLGFNRLSLGVQDFDARVQRAVNRVQSEARTLEVIAAAREAGFRSVSVDLIYGLPFQSVASFDATLSRVVACAPDRLSVFNYAHLPERFKTQRRIDADALPGPEIKLSILRHTVERLTAAGYVYIGMDHFARPDDELARAQTEGRLTRNFQGYSTHGGCDIVGLGMSAIGSIGESYAQNARDLVDWRARLDAGGLAIAKGVELTPDDRLRRAVITQLICHFALDVRAFERAHGIDFWRYFAAERERLEAMAPDGLLAIDDTGVAILPPGRLLVRNVCMVFDAWLGGASGEPRRYSRVI